MTGFGRGEAPLVDGGVAVELRSVNSRHLDLRVRLPRDLAALEAPVRAAAQPFFSRGQVELQIRPSVDLAQQPGVAVNREAARRYLEAAERLRLEFGLDGGLPLGALFGLPGVVEVREVELGSPELKTAVVAAVEAACREALEMRQREGEALDADLRERLCRIEELVLEIVFAARADPRQHLRLGEVRLDQLRAPKQLPVLCLRVYEDRQPELGEDAHRLADDLGAEYTLPVVLKDDTVDLRARTHRLDEPQLVARVEGLVRLAVEAHDLLRRGPGRAPADHARLLGRGPLRVHHQAARVDLPVRDESRDLVGRLVVPHQRHELDVPAQARHVPRDVARTPQHG